jgi:CBS domain-containing protein
VPTVRDIMDPDVPTVRPNDTVEHVVHLLREYDLSGVAVVNEGGRCIGIVTESDLVIADEERDLHLPHMISLFGGVVFVEGLSHFGLGRFEERFQKAVAADVEHMMSHDPVTVEADADAHEAARIMASRKHNRLPVVEHGRYVGVVSRADVLESLTRD